LRQIKNANKKSRNKKITLNKKIENLYDKKMQIKTKKIQKC